MSFFRSVFVILKLLHSQKLCRNIFEISEQITVSEKAKHKFINRLQMHTLEFVFETFPPVSNGDNSWNVNVEMKI